MVFSSHSALRIQNRTRLDKICEATRIRAKVAKITDHLSIKIKDENGRIAIER